MNKAFKHIIPLFMLTTFILSMLSCEKKIDWDLQTEDTGKIVVEAIITDEFKLQKIKLSKTVLDMNEIPEAVSGAKVSVSFSPYDIEFTESDTLAGTYYSSEVFKAANDVVYYLKIDYDNNVYEAETSIVPVYPFVPPAFHYNEQVGLYTIYFNTYQYNPFEQAMYEVVIDWSHIPGYSNPDSLSRAKMQFYFLKTIDVSYIVAPQDREQIYFPGGSIAKFTKYSLNEEYGAYLRALLIESQWQGSLFEGARGNLPGNISNGGLGFFAACAVLRDTVVVGSY